MDRQHVTTRLLSRRRFVQGAGAAGLGLLVGCGQRPGQAAASPTPIRIGYLVGGTRTATAANIEAFRQGLADYGYVEGENVSVEWRFAEGRFDRMPELAADLIGHDVAVIVAAAAADARVVRDATSTIPIIVAGSSGDLVDAGLAASLARPGGNVTGLNSFTVDLDGKRLQLLLEAVPGRSRVAVLAATNTGSFQRDRYDDYARSLGVELLYPDELTPPDQLDTLFQAAVAAGADAVVVRASPLTSANRPQIVALAAQYGLPAMYNAREFVEAGGLMTYQPRIADSYRRAGYYVDRILKGAKPADLPVEQPMTFDFVLNLKPARALGLTIPPHVLLQATEVIQ